MASLQQIRNQTRILINQPSGGDFTDSELNGFINEGVRFLATVINWPRDRVETQAEENTGAITLPKDTIMLLLAYFGNENESGDKLPLFILSEEQLAELEPNWTDNTTSSQGRPRYMVMIDKRTVVVYPRPNASESAVGKKIEIVYSYYPSTMTADGNEPDIPLVYHDFAGQYAASKCYMSKLNNPVLGQGILKEIIEKAQMVKPVITKEINQQGFVWGGTIQSDDEDYGIRLR